MTEPETYRSSGLKRQKSDRDSLLCIAGVCLQEMCHRKVEFSQNIMSCLFSKQTSAMQNSEPRCHFCFFRALERSVSNSGSNMERLPAYPLS